VGVRLEPDASLRIYLAGSICAVRGSALVPQKRFPGRQGRLAFAMLAADRERALSPDEFAEQLWGGRPPRAWDAALRAIVSKLRDCRLRALESRSAVCLEKELFPLAGRDAELVLELEPFRETAYRLLMRAHAGAGNPAEALRVYERCRSVIEEELGASPSPETEAVYLDILRAR